MEIIVGIVFSAVGALFVFGTMAVAGLKIRERRNWQSARGVVTSNSEGMNRRQQKVFTPMVEFTTRDGRQMTFVSSMATSWRSYRPGDPVRVIYNPNLPDDAEIASFVRLWLSALTFVAIGMVFLSLGIYTVLH